jgi:AICAR transformylase/IMP cyclohydrolase PurH
VGRAAQAHATGRRGLAFHNFNPRRGNAGDIDQMKEFDIPEIDLVIVDLYPFEQTVASGASEADIIEKIDIGGISLIRADFRKG